MRLLSATQKQGPLNRKLAPGLLSEMHPRRVALPGVQHPAPQNSVPQHPAPRHLAPQNSALQNPAPQHPTPQHPAPPLNPSLASLEESSDSLGRGHRRTLGVLLMSSHTQGLRSSRAAVCQRPRHRCPLLTVKGITRLRGRTVPKALSTSGAFSGHCWDD